MASDLLSELQSTGTVKDSDLEDTDNYGNVPLLAYVDDESGDDEAPPEIAPSTRKVRVASGRQSDDYAAYKALTKGGMFPGEAQRYVDYMRPLSEEEEALNEDPMFNDLTYVDDAAKLDDLLRHAKGGGNAMTNFAEDQSYGDVNPDEELADRHDTDKLSVLRARPRKTSRTGCSPQLAKRAVVMGLDRKLVIEHAAWLEDQDRKANITIRPKSYYLNVARLWSTDQLKQAALPTSSQGDFSGGIGAFVGSSLEILKKTKDKRISDDSMGHDTSGWSPFHALRKVASMATAPARYGYKYAKKGIEFGLSEAQRAALAPIKAIIHRARNKMVSKRAAYYAQQAGVDTPTPAMQKQALIWTKNFVRQSGGAHSGTIASLMGGEAPRVSKLDRRIVTALGSDVAHELGPDVMGLGLGDIARLIVTGPVMIAQFLLNLLKSAFGMSSGGGPPPIQQPDPQSMQQDAGPQDGSPQDGSYQDSGPSDGGPPDGGPPGGDYGSPPPDGSQGDRLISLEQIAALPPRTRTKVGQALRSGRLKLV